MRAKNIFVLFYFILLYTKLCYPTNHNTFLEKGW